MLLGNYFRNMEFKSTVYVNIWHFYMIEIYINYGNSYGSATAK